MESNNTLTGSRGGLGVSNPIARLLVAHPHAGFYTDGSRGEYCGAKPVLRRDTLGDETG
jgi:hypothetical protein